MAICPFAVRIQQSLQEVEAAVLNELLDQLLKPVAPLRHMQVFQYETYPEKQQQKSSNVNEKTTSGMRAVSRKPLEVVPKSGKDRKLLAMIDQVLAEVSLIGHIEYIIIMI